MKFRKQKVAAVALSSLFLFGTVATACDLITTDPDQDLLQVVAEVDITNGEDFQSGGIYADYASAIEPAQVLKRDLLASYVSSGQELMSTYSYTAEETFEFLLDSLVNRQVYLQFAKVYFFESDSFDYTVSGYESATAGISDSLDRDLAGLSYFLTEEEIAQANYSVRTAFNNSIDTQEASYINAEEDDHDHDTARTTPTGIDTELEDYYDEAYKIYTGYNSASNCGSYETQEGSTPSTRRRGYGLFVSSLEYFSLISGNEDTTDPESLTYFKIELKNAYETLIINKLADAFEEEAEAQVTREWIESEYNNTLTSQRNQFDNDTDALETALDSVSDSSFVLYSPDENYGFVINILLPFTTSQSAALENALADSGDRYGNKFGTRASLLQSLRATDQRRTWFTGHDDYSFEATEEDKAFTNGDSARGYLFFENSLKNTSRYEALTNYYGKYTYNGTVETDEDGDYVITPKQLTVDDVISEIEAYLTFGGYSILNADHPNGTSAYYNRQVSNYYTDGEVDYSSFVYYTGSVAKDGQTIASTFNANNVFVEGSTENVAMSMINELSFAYNTDTAGLNSYLGYVVSPDETDYRPEFEYAAQLAVRGGAGTIVVAPTDYGWHIIYCTFSYAGNTPYTFNWDEIDVEGTFSNLYYEAKKSSNLETYATDRQTQIINAYATDECVTEYSSRYSDLVETVEGTSSDTHSH